MEKSNIVQKLIMSFLLSISCLLFIIAISTKHWATGSSENNGVLVYDIQKGIWRTCVETLAFGNVCSGTEIFWESESKLRVIRAFFVMAIVAYVVAFLSLALSFTMKKLSVLLAIATILLSIFLLIGMAVAAYSIEDGNPRLGKNWSYGIGWGAFGFAVGSIGLSIGIAIFDMKG